jgi:hypothetical protein
MNELSDRSDFAATSEEPGFQPEPNVIRWKMAFRSAPEVVYRHLATSQGRSRFWAETAEERNGTIHFVVPGGHASRGRILERVPGRRFSTEYFGWKVCFDLAPRPGGGTDLTMTSSDVPEESKWEVTAGRVSVLMAMKAAVDYAVDLRNHDENRSWWQGYADN